MSRLTHLTSALSLALALGSAVYADSPPNDPLFQSKGSWSQPFDDQWAIKNLRVYTNLTPTQVPADQPPTIVAVIDTGMDYLHPDFAAGQLWHNRLEKKNGRDDDKNGFVDDLIGWNFVDNNNNPWDQSGHGTHISGLIAACTDNNLGISGIDPDAVIMPLKVANFIGQARSSAVAAAIYYAVDHDARVINLSLGGELVTELEKEAARYAADNNVLIVVAAGNKGINANQNGFATLPNVLVIGASGVDGERAGFSNFGTLVDAVAPGVDVLSLRARDTDFIALSKPLDYREGDAVVGEENNYYRASGTSFSAAAVSGLASRIFTLRPHLSASQVHRMLVQSAIDIDAEGVDQRTGYGRVDLVRALAAEPDAFIHARLQAINLELKEEQIWLHINGTASANNFSHASLSVRAAPKSIPVVTPDPKSKKKRKKKRKRKQADVQPTPSPYEWQPLTADLTVSIADGELAVIELQDLIARTGGSHSWELRLSVQDQDGTQRTSHMSMSLPVPETQLAAGQGASGE